MDPREVLTRPAAPPDRTFAYGEHPDQVFDVRGDGPLIVFLHGGFWRSEYDRTHVGPLAVALAGLGYTVATVEYRRTGRPGGGWPGTFDDIVSALPAVSARLGVDCSLLAGHSAGGHLALWAPGRCPVLALAPVADLGAAYALDLDGGAVRDLLGGSPVEVPDRYAAAEADRVATIIHGDRDEQVPIELSRSYAARTGSTLLELPGVEHFGLIDPLSPAWPAVVAEVHALARGERR